MPNNDMFIISKKEFTEATTAMIVGYCEAVKGLYIDKEHFKALVGGTEESIEEGGRQFVLGMTELFKILKDGYEK